MTLTVRPLDATLGAIVTGVDLARLDDRSWRDVHAAFLEYGVLVFPDRNLSDAEQGDFALRFGQLEKLHPKQPGPTLMISNRKGNGSLAQLEDAQYQVLKGNEGWHTDSTYMPLASKAAMLRTTNT